MRMPWKIVIFNIFIAISFASCMQEKNANLTIILGKEYTYQCKDGTVVKAQFIKLSDNSLNIVKVKMGDGKEYTLPQLISGSGARYSDEFQLEFWIKGNTVTISKMNDIGQFKIITEGETKD